MRDVKLDIFIQEYAQKPFKWGETDCALFISDWCKFYADFDPAEDFRGKYDDEISAKKALVLISGGLEQAADKYMSRVQPNFVQRGDVVSAELEEGLTMGIAVGCNRAWFKTPNGIILLDVIFKTAWRVE